MERFLDRSALAPSNMKFVRWVTADEIKVKERLTIVGRHTFDFLLQVLDRAGIWKVQ